MGNIQSNYNLSWFGYEKKAKRFLSDLQIQQNTGLKSKLISLLNTDCKISSTKQLTKSNYYDSLDKIQKLSILKVKKY